MQPEMNPPSISKASFWTGWVLTVLPALFLLMDAAMKLVRPSFVVEATVGLGFAETVIVPLGITLLACTVLCLIPQTAVLGTILLTGYLGGAVATHVRANGSLFEIMFPTLFGALLWGGLVLRDRRLRSLLPWRSVPGGRGLRACQPE